MCGYYEPIHAQVHHHSHWGCCTPGYRPRWPTKEEELEALKSYKERLEGELERISKRLEELGK